jgi:hypothetical protein
MAIHDLTKKTRASTGQRIIPLKKLDKILDLLQNGNNLPDTNKQSS